ncbi:MAG: hypothetical protein GY835_14070 [bacterium]|nr:hypothetical protein [bacterium]
MLLKRRDSVFVAVCLSALLLFVGFGVEAQSARSKADEGKHMGGIVPKGEQKAFPYELVNYTQNGHDYRVKNSPVVVMGRIESFDQIPEGVDKALNWSGYLTVESFLSMDRENQKTAERIYFRALPLGEFYEPIEPGDRCVMLLTRDLRSDNALILPTDMHYYPVNEAGNAIKLLKRSPTLDDPVPTEVLLSVFLDELRGVLREVSIEYQVKHADLVLIGKITRSQQGADSNRDIVFVDVQPEKVYKGETGPGVITFIQRINLDRFTIETLNRSAFQEGQRILCFANKDPTFSKSGSWNPEGKTMWRFPHQRLSSYFMSTVSAWRRDARPIPIDQLNEDLERWTGSDSSDE